MVPMVFRREGNSRSSGQLLAVALIFSLPGCGSSTDLPGIQAANGPIVTLTSAPFVSIGDTLVVTLRLTRSVVVN